MTDAKPFRVKPYCWWSIRDSNPSYRGASATSSPDDSPYSFKAKQHYSSLNVIPLCLNLYKGCSPRRVCSNVSRIIPCLVHDLGVEPSGIPKESRVTAYRSRQCYSSHIILSLLNTQESNLTFTQRFIKHRERLDVMLSNEFYHWGTTVMTVRIELTSPTVQRAGDLPYSSMSQGRSPMVAPDDFETSTFSV